MKVMAICAGRKGGNGEILAKEALLACQDAGAQVKLINLFDFHIEHCTGCEGCTMQMGNVAMGKQDKYNGCVLKDKDELDKIVMEMYTCDAVIMVAPTYDLAPSALYLKFAQRFLAYELAFLLEIGAVEKDPHLCGGLIAVGGSCHDWQTLTLETMGATMFTMSIQVIDSMMATQNGRPGNVLLHKDQLLRAHKLGQNLIKAINTPVDQRRWLGEPDRGLCPNCHSALVFKGEAHWDGIQFPWECAVCGTGGDLVKNETGAWQFKLAENGLMRDRNNNNARAEHLNEIIHTRKDFFDRQSEIQEKYTKYKDLTFPGL
ncbi:MAG: flavodoxin family protein [Coriobacteriales bacterium]|nr:flavodoxin family protein [Coriobacteriales bacterium]